MVDKKSKSTSKNNGNSLIWTIFKLLLSQTYLVALIGIFITFVPLQDFPFNAKSYDVPDFEKSLSSVLEQPKTAKLNFKLDDNKLTSKLFHGYPGPEAFTYDESTGSFYTGLADGKQYFLKFLKLKSI